MSFQIKYKDNLPKEIDDFAINELSNQAMEVVGVNGFGAPKTFYITNDEGEVFATLVWNMLWGAFYSQLG
jgi:hypothetical protein